jgi:hypothetical protein
VKHTKRDLSSSLFPIQLQQLLNLLLLLILAKYTAFVYYDWYEIITVLLFAFIISYLLDYILHRHIHYIPYASLSTALGVLLMTISTHLWITLLAISVGLAQKYILKIDHRHIFNPSNFALIFGLLFFYSDFHIVLGQLGDSLYLSALLLLLGTMILFRVKRWIIPVSFTLFYLLFQYVIMVQTDPVMEMETVLLRFYSVSFVLFILFMLTDPKTTPHHPLAQLFFASVIALSATLLDYLNGFRVQHLFLALFMISGSLPLVTLTEPKKQERYLHWSIFVLAMGAIILIELRPPYYFAMDI